MSELNVTTGTAANTVSLTPTKLGSETIWLEYHAWEIPCCPPFKHQTQPMTHFGEWTGALYCIDCMAIKHDVLPSDFAPKPKEQGQ